MYQLNERFCGTLQSHIIEQDSGIFRRSCVRCNRPGESAFNPYFLESQKVKEVFPCTGSRVRFALACQAGGVLSTGDTKILIRRLTQPQIFFLIMILLRYKITLD